MECLLLYDVIAVGISFWNKHNEKHWELKIDRNCVRHNHRTYCDQSLISNRHFYRIWIDLFFFFGGSWLECSHPWFTFNWLCTSLFRKFIFLSYNFIFISSSFRFLIRLVLDCAVVVVSIVVSWLIVDLICLICLILRYVISFIAFPLWIELLQYQHHYYQLFSMPCKFSFVIMYIVYTMYNVQHYYRTQKRVK